MDLYNRPDNVFVAGFLGSPKINLVGKPEAASAPAHRHLWTLLTQGALHPSLAITAGIRCEHLSVILDGDGVPATVVMAEHLGDSSVVHLRVEGVKDILHARIHANQFSVAAGDAVKLAPQDGHALLFDHHDHRIA